MEHALLLRAEFDEVLGLDPHDAKYDEKLSALAAENAYARYALLLHVGMMQALQAQGTFEDFARHAWGGVPDRVERWTNTGQDYRARHD